MTKPTIEGQTTREIFETADGMRHWWNDDNPELEQYQTYDGLDAAWTRLEGVVDNLEADAIEMFKKYVTDLEEHVGELYRRFEEGRLIVDAPGSRGVAVNKCRHGRTSAHAATEYTRSGTLRSSCAGPIDEDLCQQCGEDIGSHWCADLKTTIDG